MKQISLAIAALATGFVGAASALEASGGDPIKDGQTFRAAVAPGTDPIKDGQTLMAASGNDLGSTSPSRPNYSLIPAWQVFTYNRGGVRFIQINDQAGVLHAVVGVAPGVTLVMPMGVDADHVIAGSTSGGVLIYRDGTVEIESAAGQWFVHPTNN